MYYIVNARVSNAPYDMIDVYVSLLENSLDISFHRTNKFG